MKKRRGFTLVEILIVIAIFSTSIIMSIDNSNKSSQQVKRLRQQTIALNLAREGMETMYNIRDTNRRSRSSQKDQCRLKANPAEDELGGENIMDVNGSSWGSQGNNVGCEDDHRMGQGDWYFSEDHNGAPKILIFNRQYTDYDLLIKRGFGQAGSDSNLYGTLENDERYQRVRLHNIDGDRISHSEFMSLPPEKQKQEDLSEGKFYKFIRIEGLFPKQSGSSGSEFLNCKSGEGEMGACGGADAKELRFCVNVVYTYPYQGIINLCGIMTNFQE